MASLKDYWNFYLKKRNQYKVWGGRDAKFDMDRAYKDYKAKGGKRSKLKTVASNKMKIEYRKYKKSLKSSTAKKFSTAKKSKKKKRKKRNC